MRVPLPRRSPRAGGSATAQSAFLAQHEYQLARQDHQPNASPSPGNRQRPLPQMPPAPRDPVSPHPGGPVRSGRRVSASAPPSTAHGWSWCPPCTERYPDTYRPGDAAPNSRQYCNANENEGAREQCLLGQTSQSTNHIRPLAASPQAASLHRVVLAAVATTAQSLIGL